MARFEDQPVIGKQDLGYRSDEVRGPYREEWAASPQGPAEDHTDSPGGGSGLGDNQNPPWAGAQASLESDTAGRGMYGGGEEGASGYGKHQEASGEMPSSPTNAGATPLTPSSSPKDASASSTSASGAQSSSSPTASTSDTPADHRHFGPEGGGNYGIYDIGGKGAAGFHRVANETYDDVLDASGGAATPARPSNASSSNVDSSDASAAPADEEFGARHWGHGEFKGEDGAANQAAAKSALERVAQSVGRFFGIGPKGYVRSNDRVHEDVCEALRAHHDINAAEVEIKVADGKVIVNGTVDDRSMRRMVEEVITQVSGVVEVENHLGIETYVARTEEADRLKSGEAEVPPSLHS